MCGLLPRPPALLEHFSQGSKQQGTMDLRGAPGVPAGCATIWAQLGGRGVAGAHPHHPADQDALAKIFRQN